MGFTDQKTIIVTKERNTTKNANPRNSATSTLSVSQIAAPVTRRRLHTYHRTRARMSGLVEGSSENPVWISCEVPATLVRRHKVERKACARATQALQRLMATVTGTTESLARIGVRACWIIAIRSWHALVAFVGANSVSKKFIIQQRKSVL